MRFAKYLFLGLIVALGLAAFAPVAKPTAPILVAPISNVVRVDPDAVVLQWNRSSSTLGVDSYEIEISQNTTRNIDGTFVSTVAGSGGTVSAPFPSPLTYSIPAGVLDYGDTYYWHVGAVDTSGTTWSGIGTFRVGIEPPTLVPATGLETLRPTFAWTRPVGAKNADSYTIQFSTSSAFTSIYRYTTILATATPSDQYTATTDFYPNVTFYWRVRANSTAFGSSAWSDPIEDFLSANPPTAPVLVSPKSVRVTPNPTLVWKASTVQITETFQNYEIQIFDTNINLDTATPVFSADNLLNDALDPALSLALQATTTYTVPGTAGLLPATTYFWRVRAYNADDEYRTSSLFAFYTTIDGKIESATMNPSATSGIGNVPGFEDPTAALTVSKILGDTENEYYNHNLLSLRPTLKWEIGSLNAETFTIEVAAKSSGSCQLNDERNNSTYKTKILSITVPVTQNSYKANFTNYPNQVLCWHVRGNHSLYGSSAWSDTQVFLVANPPSTPKTIGPLENTLTYDNTPKLIWTPSTSSSTFWKYEVEIASSKTFTGYSYNNATPPYQDPIDPMDYPLMVPSNPSTVGGISPDAPVTIAVGVPFPAILQASHVTAPDNVTRYANLISEPSFDIENYPMLGHHTYYWRVRAYNMSGEYSDWSDVRSIRTTPDKPTGLQINDCNGNVIAPLEADDPYSTVAVSPRPCFRWNVVPGARYYVFQLSVNNKLLVRSTLIASTSPRYQMQSDLPKGAKVGWSVYAISAYYGTGRPSNPPGRFTAALSPTTPALWEPAQNQLVSDTPTLRWGYSSSPIHTTFNQYEIQIARDAGFSDVVLTYTTVANDASDNTITVAASLLDVGRYFWRVRACNEADLAATPYALPVQCSTWSVGRYFRVAVNAPATLDPVDTLTPNKPLFSWSLADYAQSYTLQILKGPACNTALTSPVTRVNSLRLSLPNGSYCWRVRSNNSAYGPSVWSTMEAFTLP